MNTTATDHLPPQEIADRPAIELLPRRAAFLPGQEVVIEARGLPSGGEAVVRHLGDEVARGGVGPHGELRLDPLPPGGYGVEVESPSGTVRTAVQVLADPRQRLRYGFVASFGPDKAVGTVLDNVRRLHLTGVMFYDWAYRHADLLGGGESYEDPLGQSISLRTVRALVDELDAVGVDALGYAAVYAVGPQQWDRWKHAALLRPSGEPYALGDFLYLVDPAHPDWADHLGAELARAASVLGFHGFHLDQYGYPRRAVRADGEVIDLADSFDEIIRVVRAAGSDLRLVFNNVNDFPTWRTGHSPQDAVYIEVWEPHDTLGALAGVVRRAHAEAEQKPVVLAAYQHVYDSAPAHASDLATAFTMAALFSHGATQILAGEADRLLVDPYYVRNHVVEPSTADLLKRWYDFLVEHDEVLMAASVHEVTGSWVGAYNGDLDVGYAEATVSGEPVAGCVWRRVTEVDDRLVVHLVNLVGQTDTLWDAPRHDPADTGPGTLRVRRVGDRVPRVRYADPDRQPFLVDAEVTVDGEYAVVALPAPHVWQVVVIDLAPSSSEPTSGFGGPA